MYVSELWIRNYRCFKDTRIDFQPGVSVIIGENNSGKSSLLNALRLIFEGGGANSLERYDFHQGIEPSTKPPKVSITATLSSAAGEETPAELGTVATWLSDVGDGKWEAKLTYHFYLPDNQREEFEEFVGDNPGRGDYWSAIERFLPRYVARIDAGEPGVKEPGYQRVEPRDLNTFGVDFLGPIRDVEREMFSGRKPKLRTMLEAVKKENPEAKEDLEDRASDLVTNLKSRLEVDTLFELVEATGAEDGGAPDIDGRLREEDILKALRLVVDVEGISESLPVTYNGLGYNNLLYVSLILASLETENVENVRPEKAVSFPMLLIEEPEAHLHPALQFKLFDFIQDRIDEEHGSQQIFATTHSTHITSATGLDSVVSLSENVDGSTETSYPGRVFSDVIDKVDGKESKAYVQRFLDATKSTMLFAKGIILVEGISEQILIPTLAEQCEYSLSHKHIAVVAVGGSTFKHFLPLFGGMIRDDSLGLNRRVACIVDADPGRRSGSGQYKNCYPYQVDRDDAYEYQRVSGVVETLKDYESKSPNIKVLFGEKTLEYDLATSNSDSEIMLTEFCTHKEKLAALAKHGVYDEKLDAKIDEAPKEVLDEISDEEEKRVARYATCYLESVGDRKGQHAQALNLKLSDLEPGSCNVPPYIENAIQWVCQ